MAFQALPKVEFRRGKEPSKVPSIAVHHSNQSSISIPRAILREAGLSDIPGAKFDVLVGSGEDAGQIAIIAGSRFASSVVGTSPSPSRLVIRATGLNKKAVRFSACECEYEVGRRQLIVTLPPGFPLAPMPAPEAPASPAPSSHVNFGAAA